MQVAGLKLTLLLRWATFSRTPVKRTIALRMSGGQYGVHSSRTAFPAVSDGCRSQLSSRCSTKVCALSWTTGLLDGQHIRTCRCKLTGYSGAWWVYFFGLRRFQTRLFPTLSGDVIGSSPSGAVPKGCGARGISNELCSGRTIWKDRETSGRGQRCYFDTEVWNGCRKLAQTTLPDRLAVALARDRCLASWHADGMMELPLLKPRCRRVSSYLLNWLILCDLTCIRIGLDVQ